MSTQNFQAVQELDKEQVKQEISFPIERRPLITKEGHHSTDYTILHRLDEGVDMGIVKKNRTIIPYPDIMDWMLDEFNGAGLEYKLRDSLVTNKGELYQEYLFDHEVDSPDGTDMSPLALVRGSYIGSPLEVMFGTYRFVCSNGVTVGETVSKIRVSAKDQNVLQSSIKDNIRFSLDQFKEVEKLYTKLQDEPFNPYLVQYLMQMYITAGYKKAVLEMLKSEGSIEIVKDKIKAEDFQGDVTHLYNVIDEINAWQFYNICTQIATQRARSVGARMNVYHRTSEVFGI